MTKRIYVGLGVVLLFVIVAHVMVSPLKADELTDAINVERARHGLHALAHSDDLAAWAQHNNTIATASDPHAAFSQTPAIGQNAAAGPRSVAEVVGCWMASPPHRVNMLLRNATTCGGSHNGLWWTINLGVGNYSEIPNSSPKIVESKPAAKTNSEPALTGHGNLTAACPTEVKPAAESCPSKAAGADFPAAGLPRVCSTGSGLGACGRSEVRQVFHPVRCGLFRRLFR